MSPRRPNPLELSFLMMFHGGLSGGLLVAFITSEASYAMHLFAGVVVLVAVVVRVAVGLMVNPGTPLSLGCGLQSATMARLVKSGMAVMLLLAIGASSLSGWLIYDFGAENDLHEGLAMIAATVVFVHMVLVGFFHMSKKISSGGGPPQQTQQQLPVPTRSVQRSAQPFRSRD